jgi:hypothetical protein
VTVIKKKEPQRGAFGKLRNTPESIHKAVEKGGAIQIETLKELLGLLATKTDYPFHVAVEVTTNAMLMTIDNERDALETIRRPKTAPDRTSE